ncbi:unnamed protein product, partial [Owenia fusiformis]
TPSTMLYIGGETRPRNNPHTLGVYTLEVDNLNQTQLQNGRPSYRHESGEFYLYNLPIKSSDSIWVIGKTIGDTSGIFVKIEQNVELPELITEPLYTTNGSVWIEMDGISIVPFTEGKNTCRHLKLSGMTDSSFNGIYENRNITIGHRPTYSHAVLSGIHLYYKTTKFFWVIVDDFDDDAYFAHSLKFHSRLDPISTSPWSAWLSSWEKQFFVGLSCSEGSMCGRILLSGMEDPSMNGVFENNNKIIANMPSYTKQSTTTYNIYFVMSTVSSGRWVIDDDFVSTYYPARSNLIYIGTGVKNNPTSASSWEKLGDSKLVEQPFSKWSCVDGIDDCKDSPCKNYGSCIDGVDSYSCNCVAGYTGRRCETDIDECLSSPCPTNGICKDGLNGYTCTCRDGFTGLDCETDIDECQSDPCLNGGSCLDRENGYICACVPGYTGTKCETDIDECAAHPCLNRAVCIDAVNKYSCVCNSSLYTGSREPCAVGFSGKNCDKRGYVYTGLMKINGLFDNSLADTSSKAYLDYLDRIICSVGQGYEQGGLGGKYIPSISVRSISDGSIVVEYDVSLSPLSDEAGDPPSPDAVLSSFNVDAANQYGEINLTDSVRTLKDMDECSISSYNDCHVNATCSNTNGSYTCKCDDGLRDGNPERKGRMCQAIPVASFGQPQYQHWKDITLIVIGAALVIAILI